MKRLALLIALFIPLAATGSQDQKPVRPAVTGIGSVSIDVQDLSKGLVFYINQLGFGLGVTVCGGGSRGCLAVNGRQRIDVHMPSQPVGGTFLEEVTFETSNVEQLRRHLLANGIEAGKIQEVPKANRRFSVTDPDGHHIGFIQYLASDNYSHPENQVSAHLIHAGFVVRDRAAEEHFYKDILGFRPYWHGGKKDDQTDWVSLQVPDGTDWVEFMVNVSPNADHHTLGAMNHIALGVKDIHAAQQQLIKNGWNPTEEPKIGRGGKWQLNLYDPDDTRVEFMEFKPVQKPCCSEYTGPHPGPQQ
jgi:catechol 2,3-dioxygenase-like lactoylglutathione lyase family enzyme